MLRPRRSFHTLRHHRSKLQARPFRRAFKKGHKCQAVASDTVTKAAETSRKDDTTAPGALTIVVVPHAKQHRLGAPWQEVMSHVAERLTWESPNFKVKMFTDRELSQPDRITAFEHTAQQADIMLVMDIQRRAALETLTKAMQAVPTSIALNSLPELEAATKLNNITVGTPWQKASAAIPWSGSAKGTKILQSIREVYQRNTSDDLLFMLLVLIDAYITKVCCAQHNEFCQYQSVDEAL